MLIHYCVVCTSTLDIVENVLVYHIPDTPDAYPDFSVDY